MPAGVAVVGRGSPENPEEQDVGPALGPAEGSRPAEAFTEPTETETDFGLDLQDGRPACALAVSH